ncbi:MAG TPA: hypothetical protein VMA09_08695 [Candidatus Binataceae bacterium]|nr:hypothetical protein [Candidatus Binataceae bacterium]
METSPNRGIWVILALFLGGYLTLLPSRATTPSATSAATSSSLGLSGKSSPSETQDGSPYCLIQKYFDCHDEKKAPDCGHPDKVGSLLSSKGYDAQAVILAVPDPVDTGLGLEFDDLIDATLQAAASAGYLLESYYLPWSAAGSDAEQPSKCADALENKVLALLAPDSRQDCGELPLYREKPGVILFRKREPEHKLLFVLLVGETPTSGIHKRALSLAINEANQLLGRCRSHISIVGPVYSGSARSFEISLEQNADQKPFFLISGAASGDNLDNFGLELSKHGSTFRTTTLREDDLEDALMKYLGTGDGKTVAFLSEGSTSFGTNPSKEKRYPRALYLTFPLHISALHAELEKTGASADQYLPHSAPLEGQHLSLATEVTNRKDLIPPFSKDEAASIQLELDETLRTLDRAHIRTVVIVATDVADTIFLAQRIHSTLPQVRLATTGADIRLLHPDYNPDLRGMLIATSYPLNSFNQLWSAPHSGETTTALFPSDSAEGIYNALTVLFSENGEPELLDYGFPFQQEYSAPPAWIEVVGQDDFWPVYAQQSSRTEDLIKRCSATKNTNWPLLWWPGNFLVVFGIITVLNLMLWLYSIRLGWLPLPKTLDQLFGEPAFASNQKRHSDYIFALNIVSTLAYIFMAAYSTVPTVLEQLFRISSNLCSHCIWWISLAVSFVGLAASGVAYSRLRLKPVPKFLRLLPWLTAIGLFGYVFVAGGTLGTASDIALLTSVRAIYLSSGASQMRALIYAFAALLALIGASLWRNSIGESRPLKPRCLWFAAESFSGVRQREEDVRKAINCFSANWYGPCLAAVGYVSMWVWKVTWIPYEKPFLWLYLILSAMVVFGIGIFTTRIVSAWYYTRELLRLMYWHPSRDGYRKFRERLPAGKNARVNIFRLAPTGTPLQFGLEQARTIGSEFDDVNLEAAIAVADSLVAGARNFESENDWRSETWARASTEVVMAWISNLIVARFEPAWRETAARPSQPEKNLLDRANVYIASRVVDLLRQIMPQFEILTFGIAAAFLLVLLSLSSYPLPAEDLLLTYAWVAGGAAVSIVIWFFVSVNRDRVISLICGTTPGGIDFTSTFIFQVTIYAALPILFLLGVSFPQQLSAIFAWTSGIFQHK